MMQVGLIQSMSTVLQRSHGSIQALPVIDKQKAVSPVAVAAPVISRVSVLQTDNPLVYILNLEQTLGIATDIEVAQVEKLLLKTTATMRMVAQTIPEPELRMGLLWLALRSGGELKDFSRLQLILTNTVLSVADRWQMVQLMLNETGLMAFSENSVSLAASVKDKKYDCDIMSMFMVAAAHELGWPMYVVEGLQTTANIAAPYHMLVRYSVDDKNYINFETTSGQLLPDTEYQSRGYVLADHAYAYTAGSRSLYGAVGTVLFSAGLKMPELIQLARESLSYAPLTVALPSRVGWELLKLGKIDEALQYLAPAHEQYPQAFWTGYYYYLALAFHKDEGKMAEIDAYFSAVLPFLKEPGLIRNIAMAYDVLGLTAKADATYQLIGGRPKPKG